MHYRYAIALLKTEEISLAATAAQEGLSLENKSEDTFLLEQFMNLLKEKWQWSSILNLAGLAKAKFPMDTRWAQLEWEAKNRMSSPFFF